MTSRLKTGKSLAFVYIVLSYCQVLGFTLEEQDVIFRIISSILHLGNVYFHRKQLKHGEETSGFGPLIFVSRLGHKNLLSLRATAYRIQISDQ